ncbi:uncharacterized protein LOC133845300 isoform X2 [Drosophila sulfurigaster albostrigata]|uniref:uncharacterized protein LOC133845300 isoform X2 n=1 Tax=Drosophila sulfurigaster albostrigata TaxID=89887 RepID=UPI002D21CAAD|nr:uncharacterized protein LOC133845300 isoform X2 [Drosophila sulfurigaster albostrigata]
MFYCGVIFLFSILLVQGDAAKSPFSVELKNISCAVQDPTWMLQLDCIMHKKRMYPQISMHLQLAQPVNELNMLYHLQIVKKDNSKMTVARLKLDGCKLLSSFYSNSMLGKIFKRIQSVSNLPKKCPLPANNLFWIRNYTALPEEYPPFAPAATFVMSLKMERRETIIAEIINIFSIIY